MSKFTDSWTRIGRIYVPAPDSEWMISHAATPFAEKLNEKGLLRIYFSCRDKQKRSSIASLILDLEEPDKLIDFCHGPLLRHGVEGEFDDSGVSMGSLVTAPDGRRFLYYLGWNLSTTVPFRNSIGLAIASPSSNDFARIGNYAILDRSKEDPLTLSYPWVLRSQTSWKMWYGSHLSWRQGKHEMVHVIKLAESNDGISWSCKGAVNLPFLSDKEFGISRPSVLVNDGMPYRMWYGFRGQHYSIGYAESEDGINWQRMDEKYGLTAGAADWESTSVCYPCVFSVAGRLWMLYNGNGYGATGFGLATMV